MLRVEHLRTVFALPAGDAPAVEDVSLTIGRAQTLGLVGESGSGKSVTALSIIRLLAPPGRVTGGRVEWKGRDLLGLSEREMREIRGRHIGFVFQEPMIALDPVYTIGRQIEETLAVHGLARGRAARRRAVALLETVRIPDPARRAQAYPHELSGGLQQRAMIALALAAEPELLIADEPTTALDATVQAEILDLLRDMRDSLKLSMLLITHDLGVVAEMADRVAVMYAGRIVEQGHVSQIFAAPAHPYTRGLLGCVPGATDAGKDRGSRRLHAIAGTVPALGEWPAGCAFAPRCPERFAPCDASQPAEVRVGADQWARCFLHADVAADRPAPSPHQDRSDR